MYEGNAVVEQHDVIGLLDGVIAWCICREGWFACFGLVGLVWVV